MAITSRSQILDISKVYTATNKLDYALDYLLQAKSCFATAKIFCDKNALETDEGNTFPSKIDAIIEQIDAQIAKIKQLKQNVNDSAVSIYNSESQSYREYLQKLAEEKQI